MKKKRRENDPEYLRGRILRNKPSFINLEKEVVKTVCDPRLQKQKPLLSDIAMRSYPRRPKTFVNFVKELKPPYPNPRIRSVGRN